ncbi:QueT transporter family protein [Kurthia senegalensis]|uniref:QueT transporter family protein n=1 Tax=Kurthia senegalensis TaxID=1033740 RepID=UPI0002891878|nr:QueT transporter family protein [Kurthia senegalensis]
MQKTVQQAHSNVRFYAVSGIIAALYVAVSMLIAPFGFTQIQFRVAEMFNHLIVFNKKYFVPIVLGVFVTNLFSPLGWYDLVFGVGQTVLSLAAILAIKRFIKGETARMIATTIVFTLSMSLIAFELQLAFGLPFFLTWFTCAVGELVVLVAGIPIMKALNKRLHFNKLI